jgi:hypothetical protein
LPRDSAEPGCIITNSSQPINPEHPSRWVIVRSFSQSLL